MQTRFRALRPGRWAAAVLLAVSAPLAASGALAAQSAVAGAAVQPVHRYLAMTLSPDAAWVADVEGDSPPGGSDPDIRDLVIRAVDGRGAPLHVALPCGRVPQCWPGSILWAPDGSHVIFTLRTPDSHEYGLYSVARDGGSLHELLAFRGTLRELKYGPHGALAMLAVQGADKEVGATEPGAAIAGDLDAPPPEQRIGVLQGSTLHWASPPDLFVYEYDWQPNGRGFIGTAAPGDGDDNWWIAKLYAFSARDGAARVLYGPRDIRQQLAEPRMSPDGRSVVFIAGLMSDFGSTGGDVYLLSLKGGQPTDLTPGMAASATDLQWDCRGHLLVKLLADDQTRLVSFERLRAGLASDTASSPKVLWSGQESLGGWSQPGSLACPAARQVIAHESFQRPPEIEVGPIGRWHDLTQLNAGLSLAAEVRSIHWNNEGFHQQGWLLLPSQAPASGAREPLVTIVHGGPAAAHTPNFSGTGLLSSLLGRGWAVFLPNPRGSFGQGERFARANVRDLGHGDLRDILAGIDAVEEAAPIDDSHLGLTGGSYGGFMTMWAVTQTQRFRAGVADAGLSDWLSYYGENGIDEWMIPYFGASVYDDPAVYAHSSPINYIRAAHTPTFVYVGERDIECPAPQTEEFWRALKTLGVPTSIMIYPGEGHRLRRPADVADALSRTLAWFDRYLVAGEGRSASQLSAR